MRVLGTSHMHLKTTNLGKSKATTAFRIGVYAMRTTQATERESRRAADDTDNDNVKHCPMSFARSKYILEDIHCPLRHTLDET